jgi:hypothetical protein
MGEQIPASNNRLAAVRLDAIALTGNLRRLGQDGALLSTQHPLALVCLG